VSVANIYEPQFDLTSDRTGFRHRRARVASEAASERLGASLYELPPAEATFPYHYHLANEELLIVLSGRPHLRTPEGWRQLEEGEVVAFPLGERGAHQIANRADTPARLLIVSEMRDPEIVVYPDSGKLGAREHAPGSGREGIMASFRARDAVDYWEGESPPEVPS
jgi:uncharacterized cupin superfamily protein